MYPNVSGIPQRDGLSERWQLAKKLGCSYVEVPADFVKNKTEVEKTGLDLCSPLTRDAISTIYSRNAPVPEDAKYILHTEPSLRRRDGYGLSNQAPLKWYDDGWRDRFIEMVIEVSRFFGVPASAVEIHPGDKRNSFSDVSKSISLLLDRYEEVFGERPLILLENRTGQFVSDGSDIAGFWKHLSSDYSRLLGEAGVVLDIQQLHTVTRGRFLDELEIVPYEALKGFHIHSKHMVPDLSDEIPWSEVFDRINGIGHEVLINPEILHKKRVKDALKFCESLSTG